MKYIVLGMHKSGTTLITQMLHTANINMGDFPEDLSYGQGNTYERRESQAINRNLLHGCLIPPLDYLLRKTFHPQYDEAGYRVNRDSVALVRKSALKKRLTQNPMSSEIKKMVERCNRQYGDWGFKDPRTCLTYPAWQQILLQHKLIIVFRHYSELLRRYHIKKWHLLRMYRVLYSWTVHNQAILAIVKQTNMPTIVLSYERLMRDDQEFNRFCNFMERPLPDTRQPELYRNRVSTARELPSSSKLIMPLLPAIPEEIYDELDQFPYQQMV
jgi:hypothetical protein